MGMEYRYAIAASVAAAWSGAAYLVHRHAQRSPASFSAATISQMKLFGALHITGVVPIIIPPLRSALADVARAGLYQSAPYLSAAFGAVSYMYAGGVWLQIGCILDAWRRNSESISPVAGALCIASSLAGHLIIPRSGYLLGVPLGLGLLLAQPEGAAPVPWWRRGVTVGWWFKGVAFAHSMFAFTNLAGSVTGALAILTGVVRGGVLGTAEISGFYDVFVPGGVLGRVFGWLMHLAVGVNWWMAGACLQDWATRAPTLRQSTAVVGTSSNLLLWATMPTGGWPSSAIVFGTALTDLRRSSDLNAKTA